MTAAVPDPHEDIDWSKHRGSCRVFYAERRCTCGAGPVPGFRDQLAEAHEHDWTDWVRPAVLRDSFGVVIDSAGVSIQRLTGTDQPVTPAWWRTCRTCPSEESAFPNAEVEARVQAAAKQRIIDLEHQLRMLTAERDNLDRQLAAALASPAPAPRAKEGQR